MYFDEKAKKWKKQTQNNSRLELQHYELNINLEKSKHWLTNTAKK